MGGGSKQLEYVTVRVGRSFFQTELLGLQPISTLVVLCTAFLHGGLSQQDLLYSFVPGETIDLLALSFHYLLCTVQPCWGFCTLCPAVGAGSSDSSLPGTVERSCFCCWLSWAQLRALPFFTSLWHRLRAGTTALGLGARYKGSESLESLH